MLFLNENDINQIGIEWNRTTGVIYDAVKCMELGDFAQPVKPYLRYRNMKNRIIAMPAFVGGSINMAGIKWIASFPGNINKGIPRAHSVVVLNDANTGQPVSIICTPLLSVIRTASVSGLVIHYFNTVRRPGKVNIGIVGLGPVGQMHIKMCFALLKDKIKKVSVCDIRPIDHSIFEEYADKIQIVKRWEDAYCDADIFITCTVADAPYIDQPPRPASLHINVSLRDYKTSVYDWFKHTIIVDDWQEVCRENTDIEKMHLEKGLQQEHTKSIIQMIKGECFEKYDPSLPVMFNPMGMAVFDIALGTFYYHAQLVQAGNEQVLHYE